MWSRCQSLVSVSKNMYKLLILTRKLIPNLVFGPKFSQLIFRKSKFHASEASEALNKRSNYYIFLLSKVKHHIKEDKWSVLYNCRPLLCMIYEDKIFKKMGKISKRIL